MAKSMARIYKSGLTAEISKFWAADNQRARSSKTAESSANKKDANGNQAIRQLARILNENFGRRDFLLTLHYDPEGLARVHADRGEGDRQMMKGAQLLAFGNSGVSESRDFYAGDQKGLTQRQTQLVQSMAADGANRREVYQTIQKIREGTNATEKMQALNRAELSDLEKLKIYSGAIASGDSGMAEKFQNLMGKGMKWDQITGAYTTYLKLKDDDNMSASEKATRFAKWADDAGLDAGQRAAVKDSLAFYAQSRAEAGRYDDFTASGLKPAVAEDLSLRLSQIKPEKGKDQVTDLQRY